MAIPDYQSLMLPVLKVAAEGETRVPVAASRIADELGLTEDQRDELLPSGRQRILHNRIHWAKFYMGKAGLIDSPSRGRFVASQAGGTLLATNPQTIDLKVLNTFPSFLAYYSQYASKSGTDEAPARVAAVASESTPEEQIDAAQNVLDAALRAELLQRIMANIPSFFERVIVDLLVGMGYGGSHEDAAKRLGKSGDGGIDGIIDEDRLGLDRIYIQAKRYGAANSVQRPEVQGFVGSLVGLGASKGVFVTTSSFSAGAQAYVLPLSQRVILIDGERLTSLMLEHEVGVRVVRKVRLRRLDEDFFADD